MFFYTRQLSITVVGIKNVVELPYGRWALLLHHYIDVQMSVFVALNLIDTLRHEPCI